MLYINLGHYTVKGKKIRIKTQLVKQKTKKKEKNKNNDNTVGLILFLAPPLSVTTVS
jgi:uncharacterized membrane protein